MFKIKFTETNKAKKFNLEFTGNPTEEFKERFEKFANAYAIKVLISDDELFKRPLKSKKQRTCRFCGAIYSDIEKFKSLAHLVPELIGNENLFSDFECDQCNSDFGKYENSLANFLGVARSMNIVNVKKGKLKFKSPDKTFVVKANREEGSTIPKLTIESHEEENDHFTLDADNKKITFHTVRHSYNPHHVYKAFLKMGLSVIPDEYVDDYKIAFAMLKSKKKNEATDDPLYKMNRYLHPGPAFPSPTIILFEKKNKADIIPMHIVCIMFHNYTYQLMLPLNKQDQWMYDGKTKVKLLTMPPFIDEHFAKKFGLPEMLNLNFNLDELKKNEKNDVTFSFDNYTDTRHAEDVPE